jgi:hypothetical protein
MSSFVFKYRERGSYPTTICETGPRMNYSTNKTTHGLRVIKRKAETPGPTLTLNPSKRSSWHTFTSTTQNHPHRTLHQHFPHNSTQTCPTASQKATHQGNSSASPHEAVKLGLNRWYSFQHSFSTQHQQHSNQLKSNHNAITSSKGCLYRIKSTPRHFNIQYNRQHSNPYSLSVLSAYKFMSQVPPDDCRFEDPPKVKERSLCYLS